MFLNLAFGVCAGATASLVTQMVVVPIDVVSQRLMVAGAQNPPSRPLQTPPLPSTPLPRSGVAMARSILASEGPRGLYRGFGASIATFVPSSAVWWSAYGAYQELIWGQLGGFGAIGGTAGQKPGRAPDRTPGSVVAVQTTAAAFAGCTSAVLTNPLDVIKTRLQVRTLGSRLSYTSRLWD